MIPEEFQIQNIMQIAIALGEDVNKFVFVGGSIIPFLMEVKEHRDCRPTYDVDVAIKIANMLDFKTMESSLRKKGFKNDLDSSVICRWKLNEVSIDIMPDNPEILGFSNSYYSEGIKNCQELVLPNLLKINILKFPWFIATKLEAFSSRGRADPRNSHDIEDLIIVIDSRFNLQKDLNQFPESLRMSLHPICQDLLRGTNLQEIVLFSIKGKDIENRISNVIDFFSLI